MNKRIAKKVARRRTSSTNYRLFHKAIDYLDRRDNVYKRTQRLTRLIEDYDKSETVNNLEKFIQGWSDLRPYVIKHVGYRDYPYDTHELMKEAGEREIKRWLVNENKEDNTDLCDLIRWTYFTIRYFSDRWCLTRVGRADALVAEIKRRLNETN